MTVLCDNEAAKAIIEAALVLKIHEPFTGLIVQHPSSEYPRELTTVGAIIFNNYLDDDVHFTCVMSAPISMKDARYVAAYVFGQLGCRRCTAITSEFNIGAKRALLKLGFKWEGRMREKFVDADGFVYGLLRSEQKIVRLAKGT